MSEKLQQQQQNLRSVTRCDGVMESRGGVKLHHTTLGSVTSVTSVLSRQKSLTVLDKQTIQAVQRAYHVERNFLVYKSLNIRLYCLAGSFWREALPSRDSITHKLSATIRHT